MNSSPGLDPSRNRAGSWIALVVVSLLIAACSPDVVSSTSPASTVAPSTTATTAPTTTAPAPATTAPPETNSTVPAPTTVPPSSVQDIPGAQVRVPEGPGPFPAVVLVHGGGWIVGSPATMEDLAAYLTAAGFLTVNTSYQLAIQAPGFPAAIEDVACAVAAARNHPDSTGDVTLIGHSAGSHISAIVALAAGEYDDGCVPPDEGLPDRLIGLAGPYDIDRLGGIMVPFFGSERAASPEMWEAGNPHNLTPQDSGIAVLLIHGDDDAVVPFDFSTDFAAYLESASVMVDTEILPGVDHPGVRSPGAVGELIVGWIESQG